MTYDLCAIGNALVDIIVSTDDEFLRKHSVAKGAMTLVDDKTASELYAHSGSAVEMSSGGSAANTLAGVASLGGNAAFMGKVGGDQFGDVFAHDLRAQNIVFSSPVSPDLPTGRCLILVTPDAQRSMSTYLGAAVEFGTEDIDAQLVQHSSITYLEGYLFDKEPAKQAFLKASKLSHDAGKKMALTLSDTFCVMRHREAFLDLVRNQVDILFANENEIQTLYETKDLNAAIKAVRAHTDIAVVTLGSKGALVVSGENTYEIPPHPVASVIDTTGAGDLFAAGFLYGHTHGKALAESARIGAIAAAEVISHYGPRPQKKLTQLV
jgi:sugar/nucleoside kinase (ribokinase family)